MDFGPKPQGNPSVPNPIQNPLDKNSFMSRDSYQNTNYSQASDNCEDNDLTPGHVKSESALNELEQNRMSEKETNKKFQSKVPSTSSLTQTMPIVSKKWEWLPCNYELKREEKETETYWSLAPIIQLINSDSKTVPEIDISLDLERQFMYNPEVGWNWHKSWNLPNLTVNLKITDPKTKAAILPPADLKAQLLAVKVLLNKVEQVKLYDLGLKGGNAQDLSDGICTFSGVKFSSTSYNNDGVKFHLVVLIYIQEDTRNRTCPKIMYSRISPPIFVDSRKAARNSHVFKHKKINSIYFDSFPPDSFTRIFVKRNSKLNDSKEEIIENSLDGLSHYFTAPNIRNKVKHPLFLAYKFSNCVKFCYNTSLLKNFAEKEELTQEDLIFNMQKVFLENHRNKKEKGEFLSVSNKAFDNKYFILVIEEPENPDSFILNKKIGDYLDPIINDVLHIIFNSNLLPSHFEAFPTDDLSTAYTAVYPKLQELRDSYGLSLDDNEDDFEEAKNTPTSNYRSEMGLKEEINVKRERSEESSEVEDGEAGDFEEEDEEDDENSNLASVSAPRKKIKADNKKEAAVAKRTSSRAKIAKPTIPPKKEKKAPQKAQPPKAGKSSTRNPPQDVQPKVEVKTESDDVLLKSEEDNSSTRYDKNASVRSVSEKPIIKPKEVVKKPVPQQPAMNVAYQTTSPSPKELGTQKFGEGVAGQLQPNLDFMLQQQRQQDLQKNQLLTMMMYQNYGKSPQEMAGFADLQGINPLLFQQQQFLLQKQYPQPILQQSPHQQQMLEAQLAKQNQQLWQLQQKLDFMQTGKGATDKDKAQNETMNKAIEEANLGIPGQFAMNKVMNPQMLNSVVMGKPQQFPGLIPNYPFNMYGGLPMGDREGINPYSSYMNIRQDPNAGKNANQGNNKSMFNLPQPECKHDTSEDFWDTVNKTVENF